jgi:hypothetical protein
MTNCRSKLAGEEAILVEVRSAATAQRLRDELAFCSFLGLDRTLGRDNTLFKAPSTLAAIVFIKRNPQIARRTLGHNHITGIWAS